MSKMDDIRLWIELRNPCYGNGWIMKWTNKFLVTDNQCLCCTALRSLAFGFLFGSVAGIIVGVTI